MKKPDGSFACSAFFIDCPDLSTDKEQTEKKFSIEDLEMVYNEAHEVLTE